MVENKTKQKAESANERTERIDFHKEIRNNNFKTYLLFLFFFVIIFLIAIALKAIFSFAGYGILFIAGVIAIIYGLVGYYIGDKLVLMSSKAIEADPRKYLYLHNTVEGLAIAAGIPKPKVYIINDPSPNAFATGRDPAHSSVAVTTGLLDLMNREEIEGVLAHELSHIANRDIKVMTIVSILFGFVSIIADIALRGVIFGAASGGDDRGNVNWVVIVIALVFIVLAPIFAMLVQFSISRKREYLADASGARLTRYPQGLANALRKINKSSIPVKEASEGTAHLYISNPFKKKSFWNLFSTHPPIEERIKRLEAM